VAATRQDERRVPRRTLMTTEEYLAMPETLVPAELAYGVLRVAGAPLVRHQAAVRDLFLVLHEHVRARRLGEVWLSPLDVILDSDRALVVQPDLLFVSNERRHIVQDRVRGAPDVVIEILSPNPRVGVLNEHLGWFAEYNVRECWVVHQVERWVELVRFEAGATESRTYFGQDTPIRSSVLPEFDRTLSSIIGY
jgi:Uma2 family endonuclease